MSQSISKKGILPLRSGNLLRWYADDIPGQCGGIRAEFRSEPSHADKKEAKQYMESLAPGGAKWVGFQVKGAQRAKSIVESFLGRGSSN